MWTHLRVPIAIVAGACAASSVPQAQTRTPAAQQLSRAADAVDALKSTRFALTREGAPAFLDEKNGITFTAADCAYAAPARVSCDIKVSLKNGTIIQLTRVWVPEGTFQSNPLTRQFAKLPEDANFNGAVLFGKNGIADVMRTGVQHAQSVGSESIRNQATLHIKGDVRGDTLNRLIAAGLKPDQAYPVDLWVEERSGNPVQLRVSEAAGVGWLIALSGINEPVTIPTPQVPPPATSRPPA
ncbi:MAG: LppX_LprAFG lipoprotein [Acidobacteriaceae bacterium]|jgi:hypothetical protein|nr:LppX_LprAFG lipoprotein [Acidobacteriaceae bacterium]